MNGAAQRARRAPALWIWFAALAVGLALIWRTPFSTDLSAFLPAAPDAQQRLLIEQLHSGTPARTLLVAIEGGTAAQRATTSKTLAAELRGSGQFEQVLNGDRAAWRALGDWVFTHRYALSPAVDAARFGVQGLREAIDDTLSLLGTPAGALLKPLLFRDPTGETTRIAEANLGASGPRSDDGVWVSRDGTRALIVLGTQAAGANLDAQAAAIDTLRLSFGRLAVPGLTLQYSGTPKFSVESRAMIQTEVRFLAIAGTLLTGGLLLLAFGSLVALGAAALPVIAGVVAGVSAVSLGFGSVHGITLGFGVTLIGEAVDYGIFYLIQARSGTPGEPGWRLWLRQGWPTLRLGLATSACGFLALVFSGFTGLAQLGVFSISGLVAAALTTRFVLPALMPEGTRGVGLRLHLGDWAGRLFRAVARGRMVFTALVLASAALLAWQHERLWRAELSSLSPLAPQALALDAALRAEFSSADSGTLVVVQGDSVEAALQAAETVALRLEALVDAGRIGGFQSVTRLLPSLTTQQARREALPEAAPLRQALDQATAGGPLPAAKLGAFIDDVQQARSQAPLTRETLAQSPAAALVGSLLVQGADGRWAALLPVHASGAGIDQAALDSAVQGVAGAQWLDIGGELGRLYRHYQQEAQTQALLGAAGVVLLMALWLRSWKRLLAVSQPLLGAVVLTMAGLTLLQVPLGILHLVGLLLVVAIGSNYALFFDLMHNELEPDANTLASLLIANLTTVLSFGLIAMSDIPALSSIGRVVAPGALLALLLSAAYAAPSHKPAAAARPADAPR